MKSTILTLLLAASAAFSAFAIEPNSTVLFAQRDSCELYMDIYLPAGRSQTSITVNDRQVAKPTILWVFGGGFKGGSRDDKSYLKWFESLTRDGYTVASIDYRLGLKGYKGAGINAKFVKATANAIDVAVEDLVSATAFLIDNGAEFGIDPDNIVIAGSSAGAITVLQAENNLCNGLIKGLPEGFNYAGVMSFSGATYTFNWKLKYNKKPCPIALFHGTEDKVVPYNKIQVFQLCMAGSSLQAKVLAKNGCNYNIYRYLGHAHEIAGEMMNCYREEISFLEENVIKGSQRIVDATIDDPAIKFSDWGKGNYKGLYK